MKGHKKLLFILALVVSLVLLICMQVCSMNTEPVNVYVNNELLPDGTGLIIDDCTMCGVRTVSEKFGCDVKWDEAAQTVTVTRADGLICNMAIGGSSATYSDGSQHEMTGAPVLLNDTTMVPVRAIADFLGKSIIWDADTSSAFINSPEAYSAVINAQPNYVNDTAVKSVMYARVGNFDYVDVHAEPNWSSDVVFTVPFDNAVGYVADAENGFVKIEHSGSYGYIERTYLSDTPPSTFVSKVLYVVNVGSSAALRSAPGANSTVITNVPLESAVGYIEDRGDFYRIEYQGTYGYISVRYLSDSKPIPPPTPAPAASSSSTRYVSSDGGSSSSIVYYTPNGSKYHSTKGCRSLARSKTIYSATLSEAQSMGLGPCKNCH